MGSTNKLTALFIAGSIALLSAGCSSMPQEVFNGGNSQRPSDSCGQIGCATGGLVVYPHEEFSAERLPKRWYGWDWGKTYTAYPPGSLEYIRLKEEQVQMLRAKGLDPMGRPLPR
jgi:hypothetical protein